MKTGTQASDGIGISALVSGRKKFSTGRNRPIMHAQRQTDGDREAEAASTR